MMAIFLKTDPGSAQFVKIGLLGKKAGFSNLMKFSSDSSSY